MATSRVWVPRGGPTASCLFGWFPKIRKWVPFTYFFVLFDLVFLHWCTGHVVCMWALKSRFSFLYSSVVYLDVLPVGFQSQLFFGLISPVPDLRVRIPNVELKSLTPQGKVPCLWGHFQSWNAVLGVCSKTVSLPPPPISVPSLVVDTLHPVSKSPSKRIIPNVYLLCTWEEVSSGSSYAASWTLSKIFYSCQNIQVYKIITIWPSMIWSVIFIMDCFSLLSSKSTLRNQSLQPALMK